MAKMMCILGRQHPTHTGLVAGQIYEVTKGSFCCRSSVAFAEGSEWRPLPNRLRCLRCRGYPKPVSKMVPWGPWRFVPWNDEIVKELEKETEELFKSDKEIA